MDCPYVWGTLSKRNTTAQQSNLNDDGQKTITERRLVRAVTPLIIVIIVHIVTKSAYKTVGDK